MRLSVERLSFAYGRRMVLRDISFSLARGEILSVLGANGAGKSTMFRCILGMLPDCKGSISIAGRNLKIISPREMAGLVAYIPQIHRPTFGYTVLDTVLMGATRQLSPVCQPKSVHIELAYDALTRMGIEQLAERNFASLSGGEQQMVLVARAIAQQADILIMDEPTSALDFGNQLRVLDCVCRLAGEGYSILLSTHNPQHALSFSDRVLALADGEVVALGKTREKLTPALIYRLYQVETLFQDTQEGTALIPLSISGKTGWRKRNEGNV